MAQSTLRVAENAPGDWFVDSTCIDCDACRQIAPAVFRDAGDYSAVHHQPSTPFELLAAQKALLTCPTASIGSETRTDMRGALAAYPEVIAEDVYRCGFTSQSSFGAFSYLIRAARPARPAALVGKASAGVFVLNNFSAAQTPSGNVLIDSPRFSGPLVRNLGSMGGVKQLLLTHQDDVADHEKFHRRFGCERVLHRDDVGPRTASVEVQPQGGDPIEIAPDLIMIPTPGHTRGHSVFLYRDRFLFTGDHLAWDEPRKRLYAFRNACWYSWPRQIESMRSLLDYRFEWVLPGHGRPVHLPAARMHEELGKCVEWMGR